ncbi:hypothetical protein MAPG_01034 [Magnaporthiopsis poae ATCC 64411]|uniref:Uncharacterized protein n=1 Tax=Magnaporthiopsis poae (strain ATCC 64411 / 73-15) TaxID=644358 RepID=A0A0C4DMM3_MAGP6|nr:hypothetical protein MAPG_01034 [Magnaporthiopsis poae ATCC 64411]
MRDDDPAEAPACRCTYVFSGQFTNPRGHLGETGKIPHLEAIEQSCNIQVELNPQPQHKSTWPAPRICTSAPVDAIYIGGHVPGKSSHVSRAGQTASNMHF